MTGIDWALFVLYFVGVLSFALYQSRKNEGVEGYFLGNRRMPWWAIGLSVMATQASAITFLSTPGQGFNDGLQFVQFYFGMPIAMIFLVIFVLPVYYNLRVTTAYEYLERRFSLGIRLVGSLSFIAFQLGRMGIVVFLPALALAAAHERRLRVLP